MLLKNLEFKTISGQKVKVVEIPVLNENDPLIFKVNVRLQHFIEIVSSDLHSKPAYSFREYLKKVLKWPEYEQIYKVTELKNNA